MTAPRVSVLLSIKNGEEDLGRTIRCLLGQTVQDVEVLVMDDGSTDRTRAMLLHWAEREPRLRVFTHDTSKGVPRSSNELLSHARAPFIAREDCGDFSLPQRFEVQLAHLNRNPGHIAVVSDYWQITAEEEVIGVRHVPSDPDALRAALHVGNPTSHSTLMVRTEVLRAIGGYDETVRLASDYDILLRLLKAGPIGSVPEPLVGYIFSPTGLTMRNPKTQDAYATAARHRHLGGPAPAVLEYDPLPPADALARYHALMGQLLLTKAQNIPARRHLAKAISGGRPTPSLVAMFLLACLPGFILQLGRKLTRRGANTARFDPTSLQVPPRSSPPDFSG